jgi:hypothetical protein
MKLQQVLLYAESSMALWSKGVPVGSPTRFELKCPKRARFERFLQCSRASVKKHVSCPQPAGLSLKLQEKSKFMMKPQQILLFRRRAPGLCGPNGFKLEAPGKKAN